MFVIYSIVWMACDAIFLRPLFVLFSHLRWFPNPETRAGMAEVAIATALGITTGATVGPMIAFAFSTRIWSWVATAALIFTSSVVASAN